MTKKEIEFKCGIVKALRNVLYTIVQSEDANEIMEIIEPFADTLKDITETYNNTKKYFKE